MSKLDLNELQAPLKEKEKIKMDIYDKVLTRVHKRIKMVARQPATFCIFVIPEFILGIPMYNFNECKNYIITSLRDNGLAVNYTEPNLLYISWDVEHLYSKQIDTQQINNQQLTAKVDSSLGYLAPTEIKETQQAVQQQQPVQQQMHQQFRNPNDYTPIGMFGTSQEKMGQ